MTLMAVILDFSTLSCACNNPKRYTPKRYDKSMSSPAIFMENPLSLNKTLTTGMKAKLSVVACIGYF